MTAFPMINVAVYNSELISSEKRKLEDIKKTPNSKLKTSKGGTDEKDLVYFRISDSFYFSGGS